MGRKYLLLRKLLLAAAVLVAAFGAAPAFAEKRVALVIGNDRYPNLSADRQLQKAANDAQAVGDTLSRIGFQVIRGINLNRQGMIDKLSELTALLEPGDTAAFFYAGHGVAIGGVNYLVPSDVPAASPDAEARVRGASIAEGDVVAEIQGKGVRVALLVLDACRDNPFPRSGTRAVGSTRGLADAKPARGIFTIYSAGIGQTALDRLEPNDPNRNSVFTRVLIQQLASPGVDLGGLAIEVRERVAELALKAKDEDGKPDPHEQTPAYYDQTIGGRVYLAGLSKPREQPPVAPRSLVLSQPTGQRLDIVTECDQLAASPADNQRPPGVEGIVGEKIDIVPALRACNEAMRQYPNVGRFIFQAGRVAHMQKDYAVARQLYEKAIGLGNVVAINNLGLLSATGSGTAQDWAEARRLYEQAAALGEPTAMGNLGYIYRNGSGVAKDYAEARRWFEKAAAAGNVGSMNAIGVMYEYGNGVPKDFAEALRWYEKGAAAGNPGSMNAVGLMHEYGRGVPQDYAEARHWYERGAAAGYPSSMTNLGIIYDNAHGVAKDTAEALRWYQKAAAAGDPRAMNLIGIRYNYGNGVPKDYAEARKWYEKGAAANYAASMNNMGLLYSQGNGVSKDYNEARKWYEKAAAAGSAVGMAYLGNLYENGNGVTRDYAQALKWYTKSAALNDPYGLFYLGNLHRDGNGVPKDVAEARKWYEKAAAAGSEAAKTALQKLDAGNSTGGTIKRRR
jgi:TPR repeat protein